MLRRTYAEINLKAIKKNVNALKEITGNDKKMLLPVKANAYGHGIIEVSRYVEENNLIDMLGVATLDEGMDLRNAGINLPILVLGVIIPDDESTGVTILHRLSLTGNLRKKFRKQQS